MRSTEKSIIAVLIATVLIAVLIATVLVVIFLFPMLLIVAVNFILEAMVLPEIPYTIGTWFASLLIVLVLKSEVSFKK